MIRTFSTGGFDVHTPRLIFHPQDPQQCLDTTVLQQGMREIGFIGAPLNGLADNAFSAGERFLELLTFLGCSPVINLSAEDGEKYCYVEFIQRPHAELIYGRQAFQPRCRHCRQPIADWNTQLETASVITCHQCGEQMQLQQVNWKQSAGYALQFILVHNIYLHEAVPGEPLLMKLANLSGGDAWAYFYAL